MIGAKLHSLRPASSTPALPGLSLALRGRGPSSLVVVRPALPITRKAVLVASAKKFRGRRRPLPRHDRFPLAAAEEEDDDSGPILIPDPPALASQPPPDGRDNSSRISKLGPLAGEPSPKKQSLQVEGNKEKPVNKGPLRGMDVLLALQNAASQKNSRRGKARHAGTKSGGGPEQGGDDGGVEARPVEIKEDWGPRLEELEKAVDEIQQQQLGHSA